MGLFKKKSDPLSQRSRELQRQIAALETQIQVLSAQPDLATAGHAPRVRPATTATKSRRAAAPKAPVFDEAESAPLPTRAASRARATAAELGMKKSDWRSVWRNMRDSFRGPVTSNPKLVSYLAAGSVQGLRPLRFEKRVARNRFVALTGMFLLVLWGIIWMFVMRK